LSQDRIVASRDQDGCSLDPLYDLRDPIEVQFPELLPLTLDSLQQGRLMRSLTPVAVTVGGGYLYAGSDRSRSAP
jgi:hypothetical protein